VVILAVAGILLALVWVVVLRTRVAQQTHLLRKSEERFRYLALHDALTGLATRLLLDDRLDIALESARRRQKCLAVLMLDVDRFKQINDTLGHSVGDAVLRATATRIVAAVRKSDTVARVGGDEFVVVLTDLSEPGEARIIAEKLLADISAPIAADGREVLISASIGICNAMAPLGDPGELLKNADLALYRAKSMGRNCSVVFSADLLRNDAALTASPC
jgi:diguanylate cyclase (GGDEF)-like protein